MSVAEPPARWKEKSGRVASFFRAGGKPTPVFTLYKERHLVECFFNKLKQFRRVATRYDKLASSFLAFVYVAAIAILLKMTKVFDFSDTP